MSTTANDVLLDVSYRRGENNVPTGNELSRRLKFLSQAFKDLIRQNLYWFHTKTYATSTTDGQEIYDLPSDFKMPLEVRVDRLLRTEQSDRSIFSLYKTPPTSTPYLINYFNDKYYFIFGDEIHLLPFPSSTPSAISVSSIVVSGTTATVTCASVHGLQNNDYVQIAGASESECNGSKRVTVTSTLIFTYTVANGTSSPTGTITSTWNNFVMKYFYVPTTSFTTTTDTVDLPDRYSDALSAYVFGRLAQLDGERGDASDGFDEYNEIIGEINKENMVRSNVDTPLSESIW
jgi:hypothetical protein